MTIEALSSSKYFSGAVAPQSIATLEARVKTATAPYGDSVIGVDDLPQPDFDAFYAALLSQDENFNALEFLQGFTGADGGKTFRTTSAQMEVLQQAMAQLKAEGQIDSAAYESAMKAFGSAFSMNFMLAAYMRDSLNPSSDEDSRENIEW